MTEKNGRRKRRNRAVFSVQGMLAILLSLSLLGVPLGSWSASAAERVSSYTAAVAKSVSAAAVEERLGGSDRYATAVQISQAGWTGTSNAVILAAGAEPNLVDALTAAPLAYQLSAPILFTEGAELTPVTESEMKRLQAKTVYVVSGSGVILNSVREHLQGLGLTVKSLGGTDRYVTAVNIAKEMENQGATVNQIAMTTGLSQADALSIAPVAAGKGMPILLTSPGLLPAVIQEYLTSKANLNKIYVIGGTGAVSETVASDLPGSVTRLGGVDRYDTNRQVVQNFLGSFQNRFAYLANGQDGSMADALAGAPLAAQNGAPVLLTSGSADAVTQEFVLKNLPSQVVALGGTGVVPGSVLGPLRTAQVLDQEGATVGASDPAQPVTFEDNLVMSGARMTLANATVKHSLTVRGDQTQLSQVKVLGTLYLDPGADGSVNLSQVEAGRIVVLSGAEHSIIFEDVISQLLQVISSSLVHVVSQGATQISNTVVASNAILDTPTGNLGHVNVARSIGILGNPGGIAGLAAPSVELRGVFTQTIVVSTEATVKAAAGASVAQLTVAPDRSAQHISLQGTIQALNINRQAEVALAANAQVQTTVVNAAAVLDATTGSFGQVTLSSQIGNSQNGINPNSNLNSNSNPNPNGVPTAVAASLPVVELRGNFTQAIAVSGQVQVKATQGANVAKLQVAPEQSGQRVVLEGEFAYLEVNKEVKIELKAQAKVHEAVTNAKADFEIPKGAEVDKLDPKGTGSTASGGGNVNGTATSDDKTVPPEVVTQPATNPPATGGSSGSNPSNLSPITVVVSDPSVTMDSGNTTVDASNNSWVLSVTNGTVSGSVSANDLTITALPNGLTLTAAKAGTGNSIVVTVSGTATEAITTSISVSLVVKASAVTTSGMSAAAAVTVQLNPATPPTPSTQAWLNINGMPYPHLYSSSARAPEFTLDSDDLRNYGYVDVDVRVKNSSFDRAVFKLKFDSAKYTINEAWEVSSNQRYTPELTPLSDSNNTWQVATFTVNRSTTAPNDSSGASVLTVRISTNAEGTLPLKLVSPQSYTSSILPVDLMAGSCSLELSQGGSPVAWAPEPINSDLTLFAFTNHDNVVYVADFHSLTPLTDGKLLAVLSDNSTVDITASAVTDAYGGYIFNAVPGATGYTFDKAGYDALNLGDSPWHWTYTISASMFMSNPHMIHPTTADITLQVSRGPVGSAWGTDSSQIATVLYNGNNQPVAGKTVHCTAVSADAMTLVIPGGLQLASGSEFADYNLLLYQNGTLLGRVYFNLIPPDTKAPFLQSIEVSGSTLTLTYDEFLDESSVPVPGDFTVVVNSATATVSDVAVSGTTVVLTLASAVSTGDTVTVSYTKGINPVQDSAGNAAVNLTGSTVTNNTTDTAEQG